MRFLAFVSQQSESCEVFKGFAPEFETQYGIKFDYVDIEKPYNHRLVDGYRIDTVPSIVCVDDNEQTKGILLMSEQPNKVVLNDFLKVFA